MGFDSTNPLTTTSDEAPRPSRKFPHVAKLSIECRTIDVTDELQREHTELTPLLEAARGFSPTRHSSSSPIKFDDCLGGIGAFFSTSLQWILLISPFFMWGTTMVAMKQTIRHTTLLFVAGIRCVPAGLLVLAFCALRGKRILPKSAKAWAWVLAFSLVDGTMFQGFLAEGLKRTSAGLGSVIIDSQPLTVAVLANVLFGEDLGMKGAVGLMLGIVGISLVEFAPSSLPTMAALNTTPSPQSWSLWERGEWWMLLAAQSMALGTIMVRYLSKVVDPVLATGWHLLIGGIPLFILAGYEEPFSSQVSSLTAVDWLLLTYVSVFGGAVGYGLFFYAAEHGSLTQLSSMTFLTPVFAVLGGYLALGESLTFIQAIGAVITLIAIYLINSPKGSCYCC